MPPSSSTSYTKTQTSQSTGGVPLSSNACVTCRIRKKKCGGVEAGQSSCGLCLRLNIQCLGPSSSRPDWLRNSEALKEIKSRINHHFTEHPVVRGGGPGPERPHLGFHELFKKYSLRTPTPEVYTEPDIAQQALPELPSPPRITGLSPAPLDLLLPYEYIPDQWPIPHSPELSSLFTSTYGNDLFDYPGLSSEITGPSGIMNQGYLYNQHGATYQGMYFPHNRPREHGPFSNSRSRQSSAGHTPPFLPSSPESPQPRYDLGTSTGSLLFVPDSEAGSNAELAKTSYTAYIGLLTFKWSNSRQGLPPELALYICQLAGYKVWHAKAAPAGPKGVYEWDSQIQSLVWFQTEPFTRRMLGRTKSVQLVTKYDTRSPLTGIGDTNVGWFELQIARPIEQDVVTHAKVRYRPNGDKMSWFSHRNRGVVGPREFLREYQGAVFDSDHEIWDQIEEGDVLQVVVKAPLHVRAYTASSGFLRISTWWKPSSEMLALMDVRNAQSK